MASLKGVTFRFSTAEDYEAVNNLNTGLHSELDYIKEKYHSYLQMPGFFGAVAELNGQVIGFGAVTVQMAGIKLYSLAGRVKEEYRNQGLYGKINAFLRENVKKARYPELRAEEFTTHDTNPSIPRIIRSGVYTRVFQRSFLTYTLNSESGEVIDVSHCQESCVKEIDIKEILENKILCEKFFPIRVFVGFTALEPELSELKQIADYQPYVVASLADDGREMTQLTIGVASSSRCYVIQWIVPSGTNLDLVTRGFAANLNKQLRRMLKVNNGGWCVIIFDGTHREGVESMAKRYKFSTVPPFSDYFIGFRRDF